MTKKRKRRFVYFGLVVGLIAVAGLLARLEILRIDAEADLFATTGQATIELLGEYQAGMGQRSLERVLACYDSAYANDRDGYWNEKLRSDRDGVQVYDWHVDGNRPFTRDDVATAGEVPCRRAIHRRARSSRRRRAIPASGAVVRGLWLARRRRPGVRVPCLTLWLRTDGAGGSTNRTWHTAKP